MDQATSPHTSPFAVLLAAGRVLSAHWPALLGLALIGVAARNALVWLAVMLSDTWSFGAQLVLALAPLGYLIPLVAMVHVAGSGLPHVRAVARTQAPDDVTTRRERRLVDVMASVLVPFFGVYVSLGLFDADIRSFRNAASVDEFNQVFGPAADFDPNDRIGLYAWWVIVAIVLGAWVLRWAIARAEQSKPMLLLVGFGVLTEVYYTAQAAALLDVWRYDLKFWVLDRQAAAWANDVYQRIDGYLHWLTWPFDLVAALFDSVDAVIVVPVAWLVIGAVVLGHKLSPPTEAPAAKMLDRVPSRFRAAVDAVSADVRERFGAFVNGLRMLRRGGLAAALLFCLAFLLATRLPYVLQLLSRELTGPMDTNTWLAFSEYEAGASLVISTVVIVALLAAATDWLIGAGETPPRRVDPTGPELARA